MAKATKEVLENLQKTLEDAADGLTKVTGKKMFGCHALWAGDAVFGLVWKEGRIGVRLPEEASYEKLMALKGASPWKAGKMTMAHWVLVPEALHADPKKLAAWVESAHRMALSASPKASKKPRTGTKKATRRP